MRILQVALLLSFNKYYTEIILREVIVKMGKLINFNKVDNYLQLLM